MIHVKMVLRVSRRRLMDIHVFAKMGGREIIVKSASHLINIGLIAVTKTFFISSKTGSVFKQSLSERRHLHSKRR